MEAKTALTLLLALPLIASPVIYILGRVEYRFLYRRIVAARWLCLLVLGVTWFPLLQLRVPVLEEGAVLWPIGRIVLQLDGLGFFLAVTVLGLATLVTIFSFQYVKGEPDEEKYYALLLAMTASMIGLGCTRDLFNLWVWFEAMAITSYLLVAFHHEQKSSLEAAVKYLVQSAVGSLLVLLGIALVFMLTSTLDLESIRPLMANSGAVGLAAGGLVIVGFGVKTAMVPMHTWLPDAHSQAPSGISAMLSGVVIECGLVAMLRALGGLAEASLAWGALLLFFAALNMLVGNLMALRQTEVKRMLAYSSVAQVGYMLFGFGVAISYGVSDGAAGGFFHLFNHAMMKGLAFLAAGALLYALHLSQGRHQPLVLDDLNGAARRYPITAFALSVALLGLGGLPPLAGFMSKWQIFVSGAEVRSTPLLWLVIFAGLNSVLSLGYYAPLVNRLYRREPSSVVLQGRPIAILMGVPLLLMSLGSVAVGVWPKLLSWVTYPAALALLRSFGFH
ncbi:membrane bound hydrogenase subunit mbhH [Anaerolinea thermolimosa]|uniref:complex I subunit 5 family protein n=1 Tax=Anaerolinea thermolimosa TaxID=229919 RepID=UPI000780D08F|nr:proton-conducting transporter membrane subunit [Anaerolinea thermolimosa]GAP05998.1 membrane bound hydrogenase subunit mbhH [Anaerolinea thermolimosa]